jgi:hypothetical protein
MDLAMVSLFNTPAPPYLIALINILGSAEERVFSLILGRSSLRGFCLFIFHAVCDYRQKNPFKYSLFGSRSLLA